ncbi:hypothetical protein [Deinococcus sp. AJ005]|uniref:hypothetical protein n=1 Tax=Deinococcus sp. AJ005 TaxID=2652443 RepID=UPI00125CC96A|nr:hypothetical protein [Deinococcus sp. AJ005]QFP75589.1 hypothetical protein DAAJ005_03285 [Deinococcus sp. AJ005]
MFKRSLPLLSLCALTLTLAACAPAQTGPLPDPASFRAAPDDVVQKIDGVGDLGRWMITKNLENATWLGEKVGGRTLREPINVVMVDPIAKTPEDATRRMLDAMNKAGYGPKNMHSDGYYGLLNGQLKGQFPQGKGLAFSDGPWYDANNHGRVFGPFDMSGKTIFIASFSRENFRWLPTPGHPYSSFQVAREDLSKQLAAKTIFKPQGYLNLDSALDTPTETTGDHDGRALLLVAQE